MLNSVSLTGRLTKEPEVFRTANELDIVRFTLAVNRVFKNKTGQRETDFIECVIFGKRALTFAGSTTKGSLLGISGRLSNNHFENKQGEQVWRTAVVVDNFAWLESRATTESRDLAGDRNRRRHASRGRHPATGRNRRSAILKVVFAADLCYNFNS